MKKTIILTVLLAFIFAVQSFASTYSGPCGPYATWSFNASTSTLTITGKGVVSCYYPDDQLEYNDTWFQHRENITKVVIGGNVVNMPVFFGLENLATLQITAPITDVDDNACSGAYYLKEVVFPQTLQRIGKKAFNNCTNLKTVNFPSSLRVIEDGAFGSTALESVILPNGIEYIGASAFSRARISTISLPSSLTFIGNSAFEGNTISEIVWPASVPIVPAYCFSHNNAIRKIVIPEGVREIQNAAWSHPIYGDIEVSPLPGTLEYLGGDVTLYPGTKQNGLTYSGNWLIACDETVKGSVTVKSGTVGVAGAVFAGHTDITSVKFPNSVKYLGYYLFNGCTGLTSVTLPNSLKVIPEYCFKECTALKQITIPSSVQQICVRAFEGSGIYKASANWTNNVLYVGNCLIEAKKSLSGTYTIKDNTKLIADRAFETCESLQEVVFPNSVLYIGQSAFSECFGLQKAILPSGIETIREATFARCDELITVGTISNVKRIEAFALYGNKLVLNSLPANLTYVGEYGLASANFNCSELNLPSTMYVGEYSFQGVRNIQKVTVNMPCVPRGLFYYTKLNQVEIGANVQYVEAEAFTTRKIGTINQIKLLGDSTILSGKAFHYFEGSYDLKPGYASNRVIIPCGSQNHYFQYLPEEIVEAKIYWTWKAASESAQKGEVQILQEPTCEDMRFIVKAVAKTGYTFSHWSDNTTTNPYTVNVTQDIDLKAIFVEATEPPTPPETTPITVCLEPNSAAAWNKIYLYAWTNTGEQVCGAWPGKLLSKDSRGWWSHTFAKNISTVNIIWTNGNGAQTKDITNVSASTCYSLSSTKGTTITANIIDCDTPIIQAIDNNVVSDTPSKVLRNGQVFILRDGKTYTLTGQQVK